MDTVELTQVQAMLQEIFVATYPNRRTTLAIVAEQPNWNALKSMEELDNIVAATKRAMPVMKEGKVAIAEPVWREFEDIYYRRVIKPIFTDTTV